MRPQQSPSWSAMTKPIAGQVVRVKTPDTPFRHRCRESAWYEPEIENGPQQSPQISRRVVTKDTFVISFCIKLDFRFQSLLWFQVLSDHFVFSTLPVSVHFAVRDLTFPMGAYSHSLHHLQQFRSIFLYIFNPHGVIKVFLSNFTWLKTKCLKKIHQNNKRKMEIHSPEANVCIPGRQGHQWNHKWWNHSFL